jgi:sugar/nucleoside kinase (ribokinase family)
MFEFDKKIDFLDKKNDVLTVGELLIDMISEDYGDNFECDTYHKYFGGSPSNIAMNVKRLGIHSIVASAVGKDGFGSFLIRHLEKAGIDTSCIQLVDYATSMVIITKSRNKPTPIFYRAADCHLNFDASLEKAIENSKIVHFSCWPISCEPARETIVKVIEKASKNGLLVCFDPNYHPSIWKKGADGLQYVKELIARTDIVKPSEDDAERLFGADLPENQIEKFLKLGAKLVIMTLGKDGAIVSNGKESFRLASMAQKVVDTTGAGDAFWSGLYAALVKGYSLREAINSGMATSAYKLRFTGAVVDLPKLEDIKREYNL